MPNYPISAVVNGQAQDAAVDGVFVDAYGFNATGGGFQNSGNPLAASHIVQDGNGTTANVWQLDSDGSGPKLKNAGGDLQIRNAADSAYAPIDASQLKVGGATMVDANGAAKVAAAVAGNGLGHTDGVLAVNVDGATLEIASDTVRIKDAGVTAAKLASAVSQAIATQSVAADTEGATAADTFRVTIQVRDAAGNALAGRFLVEWWISDSQFGAGLTAQAPTTVHNSGAALTTITANKHARAITDANGKIELDVTLAGNVTVYVQSALLGPVSAVELDFN